MSMFRREACLRDQLLVAGICDYFGVQAAAARVALALYRRRGMASKAIIGASAACYAESVRAHISSLRGAMQPGSIETGREGPSYALTPTGRLELASAFDVMREAMAA